MERELVEVFCGFKLFLLILMVVIVNDAVDVLGQFCLCHVEEIILTNCTEIGAFSEFINVEIFGSAKPST